MIGTVLNMAGILIGGIAGLVRPKPLSPAQESYLKVALGAFTVYCGLRLTVLSLGSTAGQVCKRLLIAVLALMIGQLVGRLLRLQKASNTLGQYARDQLSTAKPDDPTRLANGFKTCAALFCAAPLGIIGAIQDGLGGYFYPLAVKAVMDALASRGFVHYFGWGVMLTCLPVLAVQGSLSLASVYFLKPWFEAHASVGLADSVNAAGGLLVFSVALVILGVKKIALADYLPSLVFAPLLTWLVR